MTSTYFEGQAVGNPLAKRGYSRDGRPDCVQVCLGLVVTVDGFPVGYEVFAGNRTDVTTVEEIVEAVEAKYGRTNRIWVMDRGMVSQETRVRAHIHVCFLAFALWKTLEGWADKAGLGRSPRKLLEEMAAIHSVDVVLPLTDGRDLRLRCVVRPDKEQALLLERLGLQLPKRLRLPPAGLPA